MPGKAPQIGNNAMGDWVLRQRQLSPAQVVAEEQRIAFSTNVMSNYLVPFDNPDTVTPCVSCGALVTIKFAVCPFCDKETKYVQRYNSAYSAGNPEERQQDTSTGHYPNLGEEKHEMHGSRYVEAVVRRPDTGAGTEGETTETAVSGSGGDKKPDDPPREHD
jgi:hypothetical protein